MSINQANTQLNDNNSSDKTITQGSTKHLIFGAGLIGCYLGACFSYAKQRVILVGKARFTEQLRKNYSISDYKNQTFTVEEMPEVYRKEQLTGKHIKTDFIWLTVKCTALEDAVLDIQSLVTENTIILCCQNGVKTHSLVKQAFPHNKVIRVMIPFNVVNDSTGHFHRGSQGHMAIESIVTMDDNVKWLARQLSSKFLPLEVSYNMTALQWAKLQLNLGNAVNALASIPLKEMLENKLYRLFLAQLMQELLVVTSKKQIKLPKIANVPNKYIPSILRLPTWAFKLIAHQMLALDPKVRTSMWWDLNESRKTEIDFLNNTVVKQAKQLGIATPCNAFVVEAIKQAEDGHRPSSEQFTAQIHKMLNIV